MVLCLSTCEEQAIMSLSVGTGGLVLQLSERLGGGGGLLVDVLVTASRGGLNNVEVLSLLLLAWDRQVSSVILVMLDDGVVGDASLGSISRWHAGV